LAVSQVALTWPVRGTGLTGVVPRCWAILSISLTSEGDRSDRWELSWSSCFVSWGDSHAFVQGELHWFMGSLHVCRGSSLWFSSFVWWFALFAWALFCLGCVESLPLPKGSETCPLQVILLFAFLWLSIACWSFFLFVSFPFLFSRVTICGCC
jgi:hypothetical protein